MPLIVTEHHAAMVRLAERALALDVRGFEALGASALATELLAPVGALLADAHAVVRALFEACEGAEPAPRVEPGPRAERARSTDTQRSPVTVVGDFAFLAGLELRQRAARIEHLAEGAPAQVLIIESDSALRSVRKVLRTLDRALVRASLAEPRLDFLSELETSLEVRRVYAKLRAQVRALGEPHDGATEAHLQAVGMAIATVVGWTGFLSLRARDRLELRELQRRLIAWFRSGRDAAAAARLWQDIGFFVASLAGVSGRQELTEHDARVVEECSDAMPAKGGAVPGHVFEALRALEGLDDEVDALLTSERRLDADAWRGPLERLRSRFSRVRAWS